MVNQPPPAWAVSRKAPSSGGQLASHSDAHAAPGYGYGYGRPAPVYGYEEGAPPVVRYRPVPVVRKYVEEVPIYRRPRPVRVYEDDDSGYRRVGYGFRWDCDRPHGYGGW